jgi:hypothetical protein
VKKQFLLLSCLAALSLGASAQTGKTEATTAAAVTQPQLSKEEKAKLKEQQEQELVDAMKGAGLTDAQMKSVREALEAASKAGKDLKANTALTEEQKAEAKKTINSEKNAKLKEIMGAEAYEKWNGIRREQKARAGGQNAG